MMVVSKEDRAELIQVLKDVEKNIVSWNEGDHSSEKLEESRKGLLTFHTSAAMLDLPELERAGKAMEHYLVNQMKSTSAPESITALGFALDMLIGAMQQSGDKSPISPLNIEDVLEILNELPSKSAESETIEKAPLYGDQSTADFQSEREKIEAILGNISEGKEAEAAHLRHMVNQLGGELSLNPQGGKPDLFQVHFPAMTLEQVKMLLFSWNPEVMLAPLIPQKDAYLEEILDTIKEFMLALANGEINQAQEILLLLAEQQYQMGIFDEIGAIARELHNSLKNFMDTIDTALREMVEDRIPDSGNRLEHILQLTERAANTTLSHVEAMQSRNKDESDGIARLREILEKLNAIGEQARERLKESHAVLDDLNTSIKKNHDDLINVLTAQDYQDLTGQVILKIIKILKDLELKLVNVIRTFGVKVEKHKKKPPRQQPDDELYGPAHLGKEGALHSQDDVDDLLAEFGF